MSSPKWITRFMITVVAFVLCGGPEFAAAQQSTAPANQQQQDQSSQDETVPATSDPQAQPAPGQSQTTAPSPDGVGTTQESATPDPSKGPLKPNDLPNAPSATTQPAQQQSQNQGQTQPKEAPIGAAAAQAGKTTGGTASKPAGTAIAPAKQHQSRSLLIKLGAIAAAGAAVGIVYGLSRSSPSVPPGAHAAAQTP
jgi:hypothetical protein